MSAQLAKHDGSPTEQSLPRSSSRLREQGGEAMNGEPLRRKVVIVNPHGFHVRPAAAFAEIAGRYQSQVTLAKGDRRVDGRRVLDLIMLGAEAGTELTLEVLGPDAEEAIEALAQILASPEPPPPPDPPVPKKG